MHQQEVNWLAVSWAPYSRRSEMFARELNGRLRCIHYLRFQYPLHAPLKYILQAARTWQVLWRERPDAVHVQTPPFLCGLVAYLYGRLSGAPYVFEYHSAAFGRAWDWARPIQSFLARHAAANIVTNQHWAGVVNDWGAEALVMFDPFLELPPGEPYPVEPGFNVVFVCTFASDEPVAAVLEAARQLPEVRFYITGDTRKKPAAFLKTAPPNVTFTGFLDPNGRYLGLLRAADAVLVLTTRDHTLQLGGCEAVAVGKPLITSDWLYLRQVFRGGAVFTANTAEGIHNAVLEARARHSELSEAIANFRQESRREWNDRLGYLRRAVARQRGGRG